MGLKFIVKESNIEGYGCFAIDEIKAGEFICSMTGQPLSISQMIQGYERGDSRVSDPLQIGEKQYILLDRPYIFFNHTCEPNSAIIKTGKLFATKDIKKGTEITYDYSTTEWTSDDFGKHKEWSMECKCGSSLCRGIIKEFPLLPQDLKISYLSSGMVQDFIVKLYKKYF